MTFAKNSHCSYCGARFADGQPWPRSCAACGETSYLNPLPVSVVLLPVGAGLLGVRRAIEPGLGKVALPGGFINFGESWQAAGARELLEETGVRIEPAALRQFAVCSNDEGTVLLVFGLAPPLVGPPPVLPPNDEVSALVVIDRAQELAFPLHTRAIELYFSR